MLAAARECGFTGARPNSLDRKFLRDRRQPAAVPGSVLLTSSEARDKNLRAYRRHCYPGGHDRLPAWNTKATVKPASGPCLPRGVVRSALAPTALSCRCFRHRRPRPPAEHAVDYRLPRARSGATCSDHLVTVLGSTSKGQLACRREARPADQLLSRRRGMPPPTSARRTICPRRPGTGSCPIWS